MNKIRFILCALILLGGTLLQAAPVSKSRALEIAKLIFAAQPATKAAGDVKFIWDGEDIATKSTVQPAFYVFGHNDGGFIIIAGDDNVKPILAVSDRNAFKVEDMPANVKWWMERMKAYVRSTTSQSAEVREAWSRYTATKAAGLIDSTLVTDKHVIPTPEWGQGEIVSGRRVFNTMCPIDGGKYSLSGCVATAISEVLTTLSGLYPEMPIRPLLDHVEPYMSENGLPATWDGKPYPLKTDYNWAGLRSLVDMKAIKAAVESGTQDDLLENLDCLLADVGAMMHASYSAEGTSAATTMAPDTMSLYMGINKSSHNELADSYPRAQFESMLKADLEKRPIIYHGLADIGGHAFVFDGYGTLQGENVFRVNFGWCGACNGFYYHYFLATDDDPSTWNFSFNCGTVLDFYPDPNSPEPPAKPGNVSYYFGPGLCYLYTDDEGETWSSVPSFGEGGTRFSIQGWIYNSGQEPYTGQLKIALLDKDGHLKQDALWTTDILYEPNNGEPFYTFDITTIPAGSMAFGDRLAAYYSTNDPGMPWKPVENPYMGCFIVSELPLFPSAFIKTEDSYTAGDMFEFVLVNHDMPYAGTVWTITDPAGASTRIDQAVSACKLAVSGNYKIEAAVAEDQGGPIVETLVTHITVR